MELAAAAGVNAGNADDDGLLFNKVEARRTAVVIKPIDRGCVL